MLNPPQLMDPKMDPSFGALNVLSFEEARAQGKLKPSSELSLKEVIGVADQLFINEVRSSYLEPSSSQPSSDPTRFIFMRACRLLRPT